MKFEECRLRRSESNIQSTVQARNDRIWASQTCGLAREASCQLCNRGRASHSSMSAKAMSATASHLVCGAAQPHQRELCSGEASSPGLPGGLWSTLPCRSSVHHLHMPSSCQGYRMCNGLGQCPGEAQCISKTHLPKLASLCPPPC